MPDGQTVRREVERTLVRGSWDAVEPDNFRQNFPDQDQAEDYVFNEVGFDPEDTFLYAIVRVRFESLRATGNRRGWDRLSPQTKKDYLGSSAAQSEAKRHAMSVPQWYEVAPDLKAFRRHAKGRSGREDATRDLEFVVYVARDYEPVSGAEALRISAGVQAAHARNVERMGAIYDQLFG